MKIKDIMTQNVITVNPADSLFDVIALFSEKKISGAPVVEANRLVGIVSESDILKVIGKRNLLEIREKDLERLKRKKQIKIANVMSRKVIWIKPEADVSKATLLMNKHDINRLPVVSHKKVVGIVARADIVKVFSTYLLPKVKRKPSLILETSIDRLLKLVKEEESVRISVAAKRFKVPKSKIEEWGRILEDYELIKLHYPAVGEPILKVKKV